MNYFALNHLKMYGSNNRSALDGVDTVESISDLSNKNFLVKSKPFKPVW